MLPSSLGLFSGRFFSFPWFFLIKAGIGLGRLCGESVLTIKKRLTGRLVPAVLEQRIRHRKAGRGERWESVPHLIGCQAHAFGYLRLGNKQRGFSRHRRAPSPERRGVRRR